MAPYIRRAASLETLQKAGTDERFFAGEYYAVVPASALDALTAWCRQNAGNTSIPSRGAKTDEAQEIYYIALGTKVGRNEFKAMTKAIAPTLLEAVKQATSKLTGSNLFSPSVNGTFDELASLSAFRDALIRFGEKPPRSAGKDAALIIGGI